MSITEGTQPAAKTWTGAWTTAQTTASFTPEAGALLVALLSADVPAIGSGTGSVTDSLGGTWTLLKRQNSTTANVGGTAEVWVRDSPGAALTVSATQVTGTAANGGQLVVRTLIGALPAASQNGATAGNIFDTGAVQVSVAAGTGNKVYGGAFNWTASTAMTVLGNTSDVANFADATNGDNWAAFKSTGDTAGTATYGYSTVTQGQIAAVEIKAASSGFRAAVPSRFRPGRGPFRLGLLNRQQLPQTYPAAPTVTTTAPPVPPQTGRREWLPRRRGSTTQPVPTPVVAPVTVWIPQPQAVRRPALWSRSSSQPRPVPQVTIWIPPAQTRRRPLPWQRSGSQPQLVPLVTVQVPQPQQTRRRPWLPRRRSTIAQPVPPPPVIAPSPPPLPANIPRGRTFWTPRPHHQRADPPWPIAVIAASPPPPVTVTPTRKRPLLPRKRGTVSQLVIVTVQVPPQSQVRRRPFLSRRRAQATQPIPPQVVLIQPPLPPQLSRRTRRWPSPFRRRRPAAQPIPQQVGPPPVVDANGRVVLTQTVTSSVDTDGTSGLAGVSQATSSTVAASSDGGATRVDPTSDGRAEVG